MDSPSDHSVAQPSPELPPPITAGTSPLWPQHLIDLFLRPRSFFSGQLALGSTPYVVLVTWCYGISNAIDRIDTEIVRAELGRPRPFWDQMAPYIVDSWQGFWLWVLGSGAFGGLLLWWIGGWWYRVRIRWSGVPDPDKRMARLLFVYSSFVIAGPAVLWTVLQTLLYPNYAVAYAADEWFWLALLVFAFWSIGTSYIGVRTLFPVTASRALAWFVVLPIAAYVMVFGLVATLIGFLGQSAA